MDESTLKYSAMVQEALAYKQHSPIYRPTNYTVKKTPAPYYVTMKGDRRSLRVMFGVLASVFVLTSVAFLCFFAFKLYPFYENQRDKLFVYDRNVPVVFLTGYPGSGTDLLRRMLNSDPDMLCGEGDRTIPEFLEKQDRSVESGAVVLRSDSGNSGTIDDSDNTKNDVTNYATAFAYVMQLLVADSQPSKSLCTTVPDVLTHVDFLQVILPNAKYLLVVRDGRAIADAAMSEDKKTNMTDAIVHMERWNSAMSTLMTTCREMGPKRCLPVYYEELVIRPSRVSSLIGDFLGLDLRTRPMDGQSDEVDLHSWRENTHLRNIHQSPATNVTWLNQLGYDIDGRVSYLKLKSENLGTI